MDIIDNYISYLSEEQKRRGPKQPGVVTKIMLAPGLAYHRTLNKLAKRKCRHITDTAERKKCMNIHLKNTADDKIKRLEKLKDKCAKRDTPQKQQMCYRFVDKQMKRVRG